MFEKAFIIEDHAADLDDLRGFLCIQMKKEDVIIINNIENAVSEILKVYESNRHYIAFVDIFWHGQEKGCQLAKTLRRKAPNVKLVAYTTLGIKGDVELIKSNFDALIDKNTNSPNKLAKKVSDVDDSFLEKVFKGYKFFADQIAVQEQKLEELSILPGYIFNIISEKKKSFQFVVADYCKFSTLDIDKQIGRFRILQDSIRDTFSEDQLSRSEIIFLPTGDGVAIGIKDDVEPIGIFTAIALLEGLRKHELERDIRFGVHFGPVYHVIGEKGEAQLIGPGINKTARVEAACQPGRILVSEEYYSHYIDRNELCLSLSSSNPENFKVKEEEFFGRFVWKGKIGAPLQKTEER